MRSRSGDEARAARLTKPLGDMQRGRAYRVAQGRYAKGGRLTLWARAGVPIPSVPIAGGSEPIVPLVSSGVPGPLALLHLPRMWMESILRATDRLDGAFAKGRPLFDEVVCETIGLDRNALTDFLTTPPLPTYLDAESWVRSRARRLDAATIAQSNNAIRKATRDGMPLVLRDDLRAWAAVHARIVAGRGASIASILPAVSSRTAGAAGIDHVPRLWLKNVLKAGGALPVGYRSGAERVVARGLAGVPGGLDAQTCRNIGLDMRASAEFIESTLPDYPTYEAWVLRTAARVDEAAIARHNATCNDTRPLKAEAEKAYAGFTGASNWNYLLDDLIDWKLLHDVLTGAPLPPWALAATP